MIRIIKEELENKINQPEIIKATLLSKEELVKFRNNIPEIKEYWWLRTPCNSKWPAQGRGGYQILMSGTRNCIEHVAGEPSKIHGVRPVLILNNIKPFSFEVGDKFKFGNYIFIIISENLAICSNIIDRQCFKNDDENRTNDYEKSDIKKYIDNWFSKSKQKEPDFFNKSNIDFMLQNNDNPELKAILLDINHKLGLDNFDSRWKKELDDLFDGIEDL